MDWKPKLSPTTNLLSLTLTNVEGFTVARVDGSTTVPELALLTGQSTEQVTALLERLVSEGAVLAAPDVAPPSLASPVEPARVEPAPVEPPVDEQLEPAEADPTQVEDAKSAASHLKLYRTQFHELTAGERAAHAARANGAQLSALCFDPLPAVIHEVMQNPLAGLEQARLIAAHHRNSTGLEWLLARHELMRDLQVQRLLWRNPQLSESQLRRLTQSKRLLELWKLSVSREATSQTRANTVKLLRSRFPTASAEERVELIFSTEGRSLGNLAGLSLDGKTTSLLCARTYNSLMLVQNLAHWSATPPPLIVHLLRQPLVLRQPRLKTMLAQHPNAPSNAKSL